MSDQTTDFFDNIGGGAGAPSAVLKNPGDFVHGEIVEMFKRDYIPFGKTEPEKRDDGSSKQQLVIVLQTTERNWANVSKVPRVDPSDVNSPEKAPSEDDGKRGVYVPEGKNIQFAIGRAVQAANARMEVGGTLGVKVDNLKPTDKGNPLKEHKAVYQAKTAADAFFGGGQPAAPAAPAAPQAPAAPAPTPEPVQAPVAPAAPAPVTQDPWATTTAAPAAAPTASTPPF